VTEPMSGERLASMDGCIEQALCQRAGEYTGEEWLAKVAVLNREITRLREQVKSMQTHNALGSEENVKLWRQLQRANAARLELDTLTMPLPLSLRRKLNAWRAIQPKEASK